MRPQTMRFVIAIAMAVVLGMFLSPIRSVVGQGQTPYKAARTADGQPNLNGYWQALNSANWDLEEHGAKPAPYHNLVGVYLAQPAGLGVVEGGAIPYTPQGLAQRNKNFETRLKPDPFDKYTADPESKCFGPAPPRGTYLDFPFQIIQGTKNAILFAYEFAVTPRIVQLGEVDPLVFYGINTWMGQSRGRWEGDTLVVEVTNYTSPVWLDRAGNYMTESAKVVERFTPTSPNHLRYEATIEDKSVFTRPWKISMPLYRRMEPNMQLLEFQCIPFMEEYVYGKLKKPGSN